MSQRLTQIFALLSGSSTQGVQQLDPLAFAFLMGVSLASSLIIAVLYLRFYSSRATGSQVHRAFPLLGISITAIFVCIQFSLPLSLGLLGALSIVRFRTPIKEPEEIGFIMLVIATSIACATFKLVFVGVIFVVALLALLIQTIGHFMRSAAMDGVIVISLSPAETSATPTTITELLTKRLSRARLESVAKNDGGLVLSYNFQGISQSSMLALQSDLSAAAGHSSFNIFFNKPGVI